MSRIIYALPALCIIMIGCDSGGCLASGKFILSGPVMAKPDRSADSPASERVSKAKKQRKGPRAVKIESKYLSNFFQVSENLYRSAQPSASGMKELEGMGVKTVINLRYLHSDRDELKGTKLRYEHIRLTAADADDEHVAAFLRIVAQKKNGPFLVHCQHGSDRTGTMVAFYRIVFQGWDKEKAIDEMVNGGFGFHTIWKLTLVPYIRKADVDKIKKMAGLE
jgi:protein tyrosine phosphatase (PTP) superfamily phosphohydrolase (DUF442 family)